METRTIFAALLALGMGLTPVAGHADKKTPVVGGAAMYPTKNIVENAMNSKDHTTLITAVKAAGLVDTLEGPGPYTVFAPTNEASGTIDTLLQPSNKADLTKILTYHVVPGKLTAKILKKMIGKGDGKAVLKTVGGETLTATIQDGKIALFDQKGGVSIVTVADVIESNGVMDVVDAVLMPN